MFTHSRDVGTEPEVHPLVFKNLAQDVRRLRIGDPQRAIAALEDRHLGTKSAKSLGQLNSHRPAAKHEQPPRQLVLLPHALVVPEGRLVEAWNRWRGRSSAGTHKEVPRAQPSLWPDA